MPPPLERIPYQYNPACHRAGTPPAAACDYRLRRLCQLGRIHLKHLHADCRTHLALDLTWSLAHRTVWRQFQHYRHFLLLQLPLTLLLRIVVDMPSFAAYIFAALTPFVQLSTVIHYFQVLSLFVDIVLSFLPLVAAASAAVALPRTDAVECVPSTLDGLIVIQLFCPSLYLCCYYYYYYYCPLLSYCLPSPLWHPQHYYYCYYCYHWRKGNVWRLGHPLHPLLLSLHFLLFEA
mmetsp:Transcript_20133/g.36167  ORF Transcript_20133/g.36167 Transcript_20133/m.36167 type:complete len:234 (+) Transcript_20133:672-1373(+)